MTFRDSLVFDSFGHLDSFHHLARSMRQLTNYADQILGLADVDAEQRAISGNTSADSRKRKAAEAPTAHLHLPLHPRITWREDASGFLLTAETPGLRKDELKVEVLDASDHAVLEVSGETAARPAAIDAAKASDADATADAGKADTGKPHEVRATYRAFKERVRLPQGVDREAMRAKYEDGLLVVTMPRLQAEGVKRRAIAIS